jgi:hypothetical protein
MMKHAIPPIALAAMIALAGCGESVPPTDTVTADESVGGGDAVSPDDATALPNESDANVAGANGAGMTGGRDNMAAGNAATMNGAASSDAMSDNSAMPPGAAMDNKAGMAGGKPATIKKTISYRCDDTEKSIVKIDYMSDDLAAMIRMGTGAPVRLTTDKIGGPMTAADGTRLSGSGKEIVLKTADGKSMSCKG